MSYKLISASTFSQRHSLEVRWSREQVYFSITPIEDLAYNTDPGSIKVEMSSIACPEAIQSEGFVSTIALFLIFASSPEEKVYLRLPPVWRDLWEELSSSKKEHDDAKDRGVLRELRTMVEQLVDSNSYIASNNTDIAVDDVFKRTIPEIIEPDGPSQLIAAPPDEMKAIWMAKKSMPSYQHMLPARMDLPIFNFKDGLLLAIEAHQVVIICGETGCGKSTQGKLT